jgi:hypothetical protein
MCRQKCLAPGLSVPLPCLTNAVYSRISAIDMPVRRNLSIKSSQLMCSSP